VHHGRVISEQDTEFERLYQAISSRDRRFDGQFVVAVASTGVYCRPGCPSRTPLRRNVRFFASPDAARAAGFRACKRCRPEDATAPADAVARDALRLIASGAADAGGISLVASRLHVGERQLHRRLTQSVGSAPLQLARSRRVQTARALLRGTTMAVTDIAFAAGFGSVRQFNDAIRADLGMTPTEVRAGADGGDAGGWVRLRLPIDGPHDAAALLGFLAARCIAGVEESTGGVYRRSLPAGAASAVVEIEPGDGHVAVGVRVDTLAELGGVVERVREVLDLDADMAAVGAVLAKDPLLRRSLAAAPGLRLPGAADRLEMTVRAVLGQQISVAGARTLAGRLVRRHGRDLAEPAGAVHRRFPDAATLATADLDGIGLPGARIRSLHALGAAVAGGAVDLEGPPGAAEAALASLPGFGPWTLAYVAMRALRDPDAFPAGDLGIRRAFERAGRPADLRSITAHAERWRPWRAYAAIHLWNSLSLEDPA
jgi:AraC family transcriptional regulator of adaptative response / DNA-3-methyladenine glycosylase II